MKLTVRGIKNRKQWEKAGIVLPGYEVEKASEKAKEEPEWVHFGIGNIFRIFIGGIADGLLEEGVMDRGITCVETFDYDVVDKIYRPCDNLGLSVILHGDGTREYRVVGSMAEAIKAQSSVPAQWNRLKEIFTCKSLQMVSFTITEKGYWENATRSSPRKRLRSLNLRRAFSLNWKRSQGCRLRRPSRPSSTRCRTRPSGMPS